MKLLIFESEVTKAVYSWNGEKVITIVGAKDRAFGKVMKGISDTVLQGAYYLEANQFKIGGAYYNILFKK